MTASSGRQAVANGRQVSSYAQGMCQQYVRRVCWQVPAVYGSAIYAWLGAKDKHRRDRTPPIGAPVFWYGGQYGHIAVYVGNGQIRSTDVPYARHVGEVPLGWIEQHWGKQYLGWTGDLNGVRLPLATSAPAPRPPTPQPPAPAPEPEDEVPTFFNAAGHDMTARNDAIASVVWSEPHSQAGLLTVDKKGWKLPKGARYSVEVDATFDPRARGDLMMRAAQYDLTKREWAWYGRWEEFPVTSGGTSVSRTFIGALAADAETFQVQVQGHGGDVALTGLVLRGLFWKP